MQFQKINESPNVVIIGSGIASLTLTKSLPSSLSIIVVTPNRTFTDNKRGDNTQKNKFPFISISNKTTRDIEWSDVNNSGFGGISPAWSEHLYAPREQYDEFWDWPLELLFEVRKNYPWAENFLGSSSGLAQNAFPVVTVPSAFLPRQNVPHVKSNWPDNVSFLDDWYVTRLEKKNNEILGFECINSKGSMSSFQFLHATYIVSAGGIHTPILLQKSGFLKNKIEIENHFVSTVAKFKIPVKSLNKIFHGGRINNPFAMRTSIKLNNKSIMVNALLYRNIYLDELPSGSKFKKIKSFKEKILDLLFPLRKVVCKIQIISQTYGKGTVNFNSNDSEDSRINVVYEPNALETQIATEAAMVLNSQLEKICTKISDYTIQSEMQILNSMNGGGHFLCATPAGGGVVTASLRLNGTSNCFILGSSVFPSSGVCNPTLSIVSLSRFVARQVASSFESIDTSQSEVS